MKIKPEKYSSLISSIGSLFLQGRNNAEYVINSITVQTNSGISLYNVELEHTGYLKIEYGKVLLEQLLAGIGFASESGKFYGLLKNIAKPINRITRRGILGMI